MLPTQSSRWPSDCVVPSSFGVWKNGNMIFSYFVLMKQQSQQLGKMLTPTTMILDPRIRMFFWHRCPKTLYLSFQQTAVKEHGTPRLVSHLEKFRQGFIQPFLRRSGSHENLEVNPNWTFVPFPKKNLLDVSRKPQPWKMRQDMKITRNAWAPEKNTQLNRKTSTPATPRFSQLFLDVVCLARNVGNLSRRFTNTAWRAPVSEKPRKWRHAFFQAQRNR